MFSSLGWAPQQVPGIASYQTLVLESGGGPGCLSVMMPKTLHDENKYKKKMIP